MSALAKNHYETPQGPFHPFLTSSKSQKTNVTIIMKP